MFNKISLKFDSIRSSLFGACTDSKKKKLVVYSIGAAMLLTIALVGILVNNIIMSNITYGPRHTIEKLNSGAVQQNSNVWDQYWDHTSVAQYMQPRLMTAIENSESWDLIVNRAGSKAIARDLISGILTVDTVEKQMGRGPLFSARTELGHITSSKVDGSTAQILLKNKTGDIILYMERRDSKKWVVIGFEDENYIKGFIRDFDREILGQ